MLFPGFSKLANEVVDVDSEAAIAGDNVSTSVNYEAYFRASVQTYSTAPVSGNRVVLAPQRGMIGDPHPGTAVVLDSGGKCKQEATVDDNHSGEPVTLDRVAVCERLTGFSNDQASSVRVVLNDIAGEFGTGATDCHAVSSGTLNGVSTKPAKAVTEAYDTLPSAIDREALYRDPL